MKKIPCLDSQISGNTKTDRHTDQTTTITALLHVQYKKILKFLEHFKTCDIAGTELWGSRYEQLLRLVKSYIIDVWELRKSKL